MKNLLSINKIIDTTYDLYRQYMKSFIGYSALMLFLTGTMMYGIMFVFALLFIIIGALFSAVLSQSTLFSGSFGMIIMIYLLVLVIAIPATAVLQLAGVGPILAADYHNQGKTFTFSDMFTYSFKKFLYVITSTLAMILLMTILVIILGLPYLMLYLNGFIEAPLAIQIIVGIFFGLLFSAAMLWLSIKCVFYLSVAVCEKKHFFKAIKGSFLLVKGQFKNVFALVFTSGISFFIIYISLGGFFSSFGSLLPSMFSNNNSPMFFVGFFIMQIILILLQLITRIILQPIQYLTIPIAYFNERNKRYGDDLLLRLNLLISARKEQEVNDL